MGKALRSPKTCGSRGRGQQGGDSALFRSRGLRPPGHLITISCLCWGVKADGPVWNRRSPIDTRRCCSGGTRLGSSPTGRFSLACPRVSASSSPLYLPSRVVQSLSGKDCHEVSEEEAGVRRDRTHARHPCPHYVFVGPPDPGGRAGITVQLLGLQERIGSHPPATIPATPR